MIRRNPRRHQWAIVLAITSMLGSQAGLAQTGAEPLPVAGSLIYHAMLYNRVSGNSRSLGLRFAGRVSIRVAKQSYVGFGGGSWARVSVGDCGLPDCGGLITSQSEAFVYHLYVQQYLHGTGPFVRGGAGLAQTRTLVPDNSGFLSVTQRWRGALSAGAGIDLPIARYVYLTPSVDITKLPGADDSSHELKSALAIGLAITLH